MSNNTSGQRAFIGCCNIITSVYLYCWAFLSSFINQNYDRMRIFHHHSVYLWDSYTSIFFPTLKEYLYKSEWQRSMVCGMCIYIYMHTTSAKYTNIVFLYKYTTMDQLPITMKLPSHIEDCVSHIAAWMVLVLMLQRWFSSCELDGNCCCHVCIKCSDSLKLKPGEFWMSLFSFWWGLDSWHVVK